jgi:hypothetical protein
MYYSPKVIRMIKSRACMRHGRKQECMQVFGITLEGKRPLGRHRRRKDTIKLVLREIGQGVWTGFIWPTGGLL